MTARLLQVLSSAHRRGAETQALDIRDALLAMGRVTEAVALLPGSAADSLPVPVLARSRRSLAGLATLRHRAGGADVVIAHGSKTLPACALALAGSTPFIYANIGDPRFWAATPVRRVRVRAMLGRAAAVAAISDGARSALVDYVGVPEDRVVVIPNGRPAHRFPPITAGRRAEARAHVRVPAAAAVAVVVAALSDEKRVDLAIRAVASVPDLWLLIAGDGPLRADLQRLADDVAPGRVRLLGAVPEPAAVLAAADLLLLTSDSEGVPGVLIEAGLSGLPVVCTDVGWCGEVVVAGETGLLVPPGSAQSVAQALREVLPQAPALGERARRRCLERFEISQVAVAWAQLAERVVEGRATTGSSRQVKMA